MIVEINSKEEKEQEQFEQDGLEDSQTGSREEIDPEVLDDIAEACMVTRTGKE